MASRRTSPKPAATAAAGPASPLGTAFLVSGALVYGLWLLISGGRVSWPPTELLSGASTLAGCLALIGPLVLARREGGDAGLGELAWMTGGLLFWVNDLGSLIQGGWRSVSWVAPLGMRALGLTILAVLAAGWRLRGTGGRSWSWTNVTGWALGIFWIGMAVASFVPARGIGLAAR